jgi:hypothetical protein
MGALVATPHTATAAARAPVAVALGTAANFAVLAGKAVVNTGSTVVTGDLGVNPSSSVNGFPPGTVSGATHAADAVAAQAQTDLTTAYNDAGTQTPATTVPTQLGGTTLGPGIYKSAAGTFQIAGNLTLDAQGDPGAVFIFQTTSSLSTGTASTVTLTGGAQECNVFWKVGSSVALGTNSNFTGNILALNSISAGGGATVKGRTLARNGIVTLNRNTVTPSVCETPPGTTQTAPGTTQAAPGAMQVAPGISLASMCIPVQGSGFAFTIPVSALSTAVPPGSVAFFATGPVLGAPQFDATGQAVPTLTDSCEGAGQAPATSGTPGTVTPGSGTPGTVTPGSGTPGSGTPGTVTPGAGTPGAGTPGTGIPGAPSAGTPGAPGTVAPSAGTPSSGTVTPSVPGTGTPGAPGTVTPGTGTPGTRA